MTYVSERVFFITSPCLLSFLLKFFVCFRSLTGKLPLIVALPASCLDEPNGFGKALLRIVSEGCRSPCLGSTLCLSPFPHLGATWGGLRAEVWYRGTDITQLLTLTLGCSLTELRNLRDNKPALGFWEVGFLEIV